MTRDSSPALAASDVYSTQITWTQINRVALLVITWHIFLGNTVKFYD